MDSNKCFCLPGWLCHFSTQSSQHKGGWQITFKEDVFKLLSSLTPFRTWGLINHLASLIQDTLASSCEGTIKRKPLTRTLPESPPLPVPSLSLLAFSGQKQPLLLLTGAEKWWATSLLCLVKQSLTTDRGHELPAGAMASLRYSVSGRSNTRIWFVNKGPSSAHLEDVCLAWDVIILLGHRAMCLALCAIRKQKHWCSDWGNNSETLQEGWPYRIQL